MGLLLSHTHLHGENNGLQSAFHTDRLLYNKAHFNKLEWYSLLWKHIRDTILWRSNERLCFASPSLDVTKNGCVAGYPFPTLGTSGFSGAKATSGEAARKAFRAGHYKDLAETGNRARKVSGTQGTPFQNKTQIIHGCGLGHYTVNPLFNPPPPFK